MPTLRSPALDDPLHIRRADPELLSLALIDARNLTLRWLDVFEARGLVTPASEADAGGAAATATSVEAAGGRAALPTVAWLIGHAAWYQEWWITRHVQRGRGEHCDPTSTRLAPIEPRGELCYRGGGPQLLDPGALRSWLADTLEVTLELLGTAGDGDDALHFYRAALLHEDRIGQALAERAALLRLAPMPDPPPPLGAPPSRASREPIAIPAQSVELGSPRGGFVPDNERWAEPVAVPDFDIDAQPVDWERYVEFADDGGYDRPELWTDPGWAWLQASNRRAPRDVEQLRGGVLLHRLGRVQRAPAGQPAMHLTRHEAQAWCRWAGRRLPTEPEWELAALGARQRGFVWGEVFEWVAGSARPWTGYAATPGSLDPMPAPGSMGVLRGASMSTPPRWRHPKARRFMAVDDDHAFCGFRSCAL